MPVELPLAPPIKLQDTSPHRRRTPEKWEPEARNHKRGAKKLETISKRPADAFVPDKEQLTG